MMNIKKNANLSTFHIPVHRQKFNLVKVYEGEYLLLAKEPKYKTHVNKVHSHLEHSFVCEVSGFVPPFMKLKPLDETAEHIWWKWKHCQLWWLNWRPESDTPGVFPVSNSLHVVQSNRSMDFWSHLLVYACWHLLSPIWKIRFMNVTSIRVFDETRPGLAEVHTVVGVKMTGG